MGVKMKNNNFIQRTLTIIFIITVVVELAITVGYAMLSGALS